MILSNEKDEESSLLSSNQTSPDYVTHHKSRNNLLFSAHQCNSSNSVLYHPGKFCYYKRASPASASVSHSSPETEESHILLTKYNRNPLVRLLFGSNEFKDLLSALLPSSVIEGKAKGEEKPTKITKETSTAQSMTFRILFLIIIGFHCITPFAYCYFMLMFLFPVSFAKFFSLFPIEITLFSLWMIVEIAFFPYYFILFCHFNSFYNYKLKHRCDNAISRFKLLIKCCEALILSSSAKELPEQRMRNVIQGWFLEEPLIKICYGNLSSWTAWAYFGKDIKHMSEKEVLENNELVDYKSKLMKWRFPPGFNNRLPSLPRTNIDPIFASQRPFSFYFMIACLNQLSHLLLKKLFNFKLLKEFSTKGQKIYFRRAYYGHSKRKEKEAEARENNMNHKKPYPIVFLHGIGAGFFHYLPLISKFPNDVDVFLIEWPAVAIQMTTIAPTPKESVSLIVKALDHYHHDKATFLTHSLGTSLVSWMLHDPIAARRLANSILLDPVVFLLCDPGLEAHFVYKHPTASLDLLMHFFLAR
jgi:hypothetical protein